MVMYGMEIGGSLFENLMNNQISADVKFVGIYQDLPYFKHFVAQVHIPWQDNRLS